MLDVAVVGAGPIGLVAARTAALQGARVRVFERKASLDPPSCCAGLVSPRTLPVLGVSDACVQRRIRGVRVVSPAKHSVELRSEDDKAYVIDRRVLEAELLRSAVDAGVRITFSAEVTAARIGTLEFSSGSGLEPFEAHVIIAADGPDSRTASAMGLTPPPEAVHAAQVEIAVDPVPLDFVTVYLGQEYAPGFLGWSVPAQDGVLRVGLGVQAPADPGPGLRRLLGNWYPSAHVLSSSKGKIALGMRPWVVGERMLAVGDAAGQAKPISGGGLFPGGVCARLAGLCASRAARADDPSRALQQYAEGCLRLIGREMAFGRSVRQLFARMGDADIDRTMTAFSNPEFLTYVAKHADIDRLHRLPDMLAKHPQWWGQMIRIIPALFSPSS